MTNMEAFLIRDGSYLDASYDEIFKAYGSLESYLEDGLGLSREEIGQLQEALLE